MICRLQRRKAVRNYPWFLKHVFKNLNSQISSSLVFRKTAHQICQTVYEQPSLLLFQVHVVHELLSVWLYLTIGLALGVFPGGTCRVEHSLYKNAGRDGFLRSTWAEKVSESLHLRF